MKTLDMALLLIFHPTDFYEETKLNYQKYSAVPGIILMLLVIAARYIYVLTVHRPLADIALADTNFLLEMLRITLPLLTWIVSIYAVTSILYGETKIKMIFMSATYSFIPFIVITLLSIPLSHILSLEESGYYYVLQAGMWIWVVLLLFFGVMLMNNFSFAKTVFVCILSIVGVALIWAAVVMVIALTVQITGFFNEIIREYVIDNL